MNSARNNYFFYLCCFILFSTALYAKEIQIQISPANPIVGEQIKVTAVINRRITRSDQIGIKTFPTSNGIRFNPNNIEHSNHQNYINGKASFKFLIYWQGQAIKPGKQTITPLEVKINNDIYKSKPLSIEVFKKQTKDFYLIQTSTDSKDAFVGQAINFHVDYIISDQQAHLYDKTQGGRGFQLENLYRGLKIPESLQKDFYVTPKVYNDQYKRNDVYFGKAIENIKIKGFSYRRHRVTLSLEPKRTGRLTIPSIHCNYIPFEVKRHRVFGGFMVQDSLQASSKRIPVNSKPILLKVSDPPKDAQPATYNGLVCRKLNVSMSIPDIKQNQKIQLHSPISVEITLKSDLPQQSLQLPDWSTQTALTQSFDVSAHTALKENVEGGVRFKEIIFRPKAKNAKEIPAIEISYFDPDQKKYLKVFTKPFPIQVEALSIDDQLAEQPSQFLNLPKSKIKESTIGRIEGLEQSLNKLNSNSSKQYPPIIMYCLALLPWLGFLSINILSKIKSGNAQKRKDNQFGLKDSLQKIDSCQSPSQLLDIISQYISHRWGVKDPRAINIQNKDLKEKLDNLLGQLEAASYASSTAAENSLPTQDAQDLLQELDRT